MIVQLRWLGMKIKLSNKLDQPSKKADYIDHQVKGASHENSANNKEGIETCPSNKLSQVPKGLVL